MLAIAAVLVVFILLLLLGVAVYIAMGLVSTVLFMMQGHSLAGVAQIVLDRLNSGTLISLPFFIIAAAFMQRGGIAEALLRAANSWVGHRPSGLALACVVAALVFSSISGSTTATAMALGVILVPAMIRRGYPQHFSLGTIGASGTLGILIPPSLALIIYGLIANASIPQLFLAGVVPGLVQGLLFGIWILFWSRGAGLPAGAPCEWRERAAVNLRALPALAVPVLVLGGIYSGWITIVEASALAAILSMAVSCLVYRGCGWRDLNSILAEAMVRSASILLIVAMATAFSHWIISSGLPQQLVGHIVAAELQPWQFLLAMNLIMIAMGMVLEVISVILITMPLVLPSLGALGIDPVHYGIVIIVNMGLATITPPVGLNLFVLQNISNAPFREVLRGSVPYMLLLMILLVLVTFVPSLSLWLPRLIYAQ